MKISLNWLREFVDLPETPDELRVVLDDLGLVVEGIERVGDGLDDVVVARVEEIRPIPGADRVRLVVVEAGNGPLEIVCGATNFAVGNHVPLAPVGARLPGDFVISARTMRGVTSQGMLCSSRELNLSDEHEGLMVLDAVVTARPGEHLLEALGVVPDAVFDISVEGNRPDAWSVEGVARDLATRLGRTLRSPACAEPNSPEDSATFASAGIDDSDLCGRLTVSVLRNVSVVASPTWIAQRLLGAGLRPISNVVDASNLVMLELGQPTHPYDASRVGRRTLRARRARPGETLTTLDGVERVLARGGRGLGDTGEDCVIVDGDDQVLGLAGIMGGASSEIGSATTDVLLEAAYFDPMAIARSSKRHALRSEASHRFARGVDPQLALRASARFVEILKESSPGLEWLSAPLDVAGVVPAPATVELADEDVERLLGVAIDGDVVSSVLTGLGFVVREDGGRRMVTAPSNRPDVRTGRAGRADVVEEVARLYGYARLPRRTPSWPEVGGLNARQRMRRRLRDVIVALGAIEVWTPSLGNDADFNLVDPDEPRLRLANPFSSDESVLRATMLAGLVKVWARNAERGLGDLVLAEFGVVFVHPGATSRPHVTRGGAGGVLSLTLPEENERLTMVLARTGDDARSAVAMWRVIERRLGLADVVVRSLDQSPRGLHPTRAGALIDRASGSLLGYLGEVDPLVVSGLSVTSTLAPRRLGVIDLDLNALADPTSATRSPALVRVPSRYPSASLDLAFVVPNAVHAADVAHRLRTASGLVEDVTLFDVYRGPGLADAVRGLAYSVRLSSPEGTLSDTEVSACRLTLIDAAASLGATLR